MKTAEPANLKTADASTRRIHLLCNAHIDPVWLWEWEEGVAAAISTFRTAADLCEEFDGFIFNHNEAILYQWVEEHEPELFRRIVRLVRRGRWNIMGGWFLQPDCNMPSGESFVRQALVGKRYFREKFGVEVSTAINFDPFGHTRGLVQILARSGSDAYLFCRPDQKDCPLPADDFVWVGYDGSEVLASRVLGWYNSPLGKAHEKILARMKDAPDRAFSLVLWGVGDHGGGPSRTDLQRIGRLIRSTRDFRILHSTPQAYFRELARIRDRLPRRAADLNPWGVGCYTSQIRIKQRHRRLENELYAVEKMAVAAAGQGLMPYPRSELQQARRDLLTGEFHDILPGSSIQPVEEMSLRLMDHGLEILSRVKARAFFVLARGQKPARDGEIPILVHNPHPYPVRTLVECEFQLADANWGETWTVPTVFQRGRPVPCQLEKELSNLNLDWRKRVVFQAELAPAQMNRFDCRLKTLPARPAPPPPPAGPRIRWRTDDLDVVINTRTGLVDRYRVRGVDCLRPGAFQPVVLADNEDPWGMLDRRFGPQVAAFELMSPRQAARFAGVRAARLAPVRVIEDGPVRMVVEVLMRCGDSFICQHYRLPRRGTEIEVETRVHWNEKNRMLKLAVPVRAGKPRYLGQVAFGVGELPDNGDEAVAQKWVAVVDQNTGRALTCINDGVYGSDFSGGVLRLSLLRSPAYSGHPLLERPIVPQDRYLPRIDQGERVFRFWFNAGPARRRLQEIDREALARNERPFALSFFPGGRGRAPRPGVVLGDDVVQMPALKLAEDGNDLIVRLFEPTGQPRSTRLSIPFAGVKTTVRLAGFEVKTLRISPAGGKVVEVDLLERPIRPPASKARRSTARPGR